ncbi:hypothetical protein AVEN_254557-1 [Araneus ventricosus]|uniref:Uncharacterized protein n=1 Tax=Araneus ventricosus TaxID=182803 RepID=A0A4Y2P8C5_ARAVE|nr:hypothetical protein AVEN_254557-1 [Araneus ventricosus]
MSITEDLQRDPADRIKIPDSQAVRLGFRLPRCCLCPSPEFWRKDKRRIKYCSDQRKHNSHSDVSNYSNGFPNSFKSKDGFILEGERRIGMGLKKCLLFISIIVSAKTIQTMRGRSI